MEETNIISPTNFLGLPEKFSRRDKARFLILPVPYDQTVSYVPGARFAPRAIIEASSQIELYDEEMNSEPYLAGIHTLPAIEPIVSEFTEMVKKIESVCEPIVGENKFIILLGGEHTISLGLINTLLKQQKKRAEKFAVLQFDAHADLRSSYQGSKYSHACVARRILDMKLPVVQVGVRSLSRQEREFAMKNKLLEQVSMWQVNTNSMEKVITHILSLLPPKIYLSIDVDVLDPSIMPAVGTPEPGGLGWYQLLRILRAIILSREIIGCDITELNPLPGYVAPNVLVARLVYKIIAYIQHARE
ncbi:agmatinase [Candidatus Sumerlaeota bacterium]|nr:agmatinase [Candidatus Sumerlaeota bacterium]